MLRLDMQGLSYKFRNILAIHMCTVLVVKHARHTILGRTDRASILTTRRHSARMRRARRSMVERNDQYSGRELYLISSVLLYRAAWRRGLAGLAGPRASVMVRHGV
jgi:hypothetical protein